MRLVALAIPVVLAVGGAGYYISKPKEDPAMAALLARLDEPIRPRVATAAEGVLLTEEDRLADGADAEILASVGENKDLTEDESNAVLTAAGRRFIRRKMAFERVQREVDAGRTPAARLEPIRREMASARRIYDLAESLGRRTRILMSLARAERIDTAPSLISGLADRHTGTHATVSPDDLAEIQRAFEAEFRKPLPVSANGASAVHRALGFDHAGRVDVAVSPEGSQGVWLRRYLIGRGFSYFAFRSAVSGQSTGAHIHIGAASGHN
jgi:hypothetical protein